MADFEIIGLSELIAKIEPNELLGIPLRDFFEKSTSMVAYNIVKHTPIDRGILAASINDGREIDSSPIPTWGKVGTNLQPHYGPDIEYGTQPHWPPVGVLQDWARRHGMGKSAAFLIGRAISRRGTRAYEMFRRGFEDSLGDIEEYADETAKQIEEIFSK